MIFEAFEAMKRQLTLREIAAHCDLPVSSCHALVQTLLQRGYLYTLGRRKELYPNRRILSLAQTIVDNDPFIARFSADLEAMRDACQETVTVGKRQGDVLQYIYTLDCPQAIRYAAKPGDSRPLHSTATGKALLSVLPQEELDEWLRTASLKAITSKTITSRQRLLKDIEAGRARGYFIGAGEQSEDLDVVSVPVFLNNDVIGIAIAGPSYRVKPAMAKLAGRLLALKKRLEGAVAREAKAA
jgi:DNA-binding IclR family transcriptional regulator